jgi:type VII secretion-associated protein (TIGR03931 family)
MRAHIVEVGPRVVRQLCCDGGVTADSEMISAAFDCIDDPVALLKQRPVAVDALWRRVLGSVDCGNPERVTVIHPSWWAPSRIEVVSSAAQCLAGEIVMRPRSWLLTLESTFGPHRETVVVEIAEGFVVITGAAVVAETRRGEPRAVAEAVVRSIVDVAKDGHALAVIDVPSAVDGAAALATMIAEEARASGGMTAVQVDEARLRELAALGVAGDDSAAEPDIADAGQRHGRRLWAVALLVVLVVLAVALLGISALGRRGAPANGGPPTTYLVEGHVALEVPADWPIRRVLAGPGSARVQVTSPADPDVALHVTQSRVALESLGATAEFLKQAIDAEPAGTFVDFNPADRRVGRPAATYREVRSGHDIRWTVWVDKAVRISIGCQSPHGRDDAVRQACELAVRSARALS